MEQRCREFEQLLKEKENDNKEEEGRLKDLWKTYGLHTEAGRMLFKTYSRGKKTSINYPKPQQKKWKNPNLKRAKSQRSRKKKI